MSISIETQSDKGMSAPFPASQDEDLSDNEDGSSSLSDIEDRDADQEGMEPATSDIENASEGNESDDNDTEAETERLENSPHSARKQKDVVMTSYNETKTYERSPSKLQNQLLAAREEEDDRNSGDDDSGNESAKSGSGDELNTSTAPTSLDSSVEGKKAYTSIPDAYSKKRKRHTIMDGGVADNSDHSEPAKKRVGSIMDGGNTYLEEDEDVLVEEDDVENSNHVSGEDGAGDQDDNEDLQQIVGNKGALEMLAEASSKKADKRNTRKSQEITQNGSEAKAQGLSPAVTKVNGNQILPDKGTEEETVEVEEFDEADVALKNEEEGKSTFMNSNLAATALIIDTVERKRTAIDQLSAIEKHLKTFRSR